MEWTAEDDRTLIIMLRHKGASFDQVAAKLKRTKRAILFRVDKIIEFHVQDEGPYVDEVCEWLMPHIPFTTWMTERTILFKTEILPTND
jgi:hypothetical protein